jgi:hypothetical protein
MQSIALSHRRDAAPKPLPQSVPRVGTGHTYCLNGSLLRDVLVDGAG